MGIKKFLDAKSLFFVMHLGCIFAKIKVAFVAENYIIVSQSIQKYFAVLQLHARFDVATKPHKRLASTEKGTVGRKIWGTGGRCCDRPIIIISKNYHLRWLLLHKNFSCQLSRINANALRVRRGIRLTVSCLLTYRSMLNCKPLMRIC